MRMYRARYTYTCILVFDSSLRRQKIFSEPVCSKFVMNTVAPRQFDLQVLLFAPVGVIPPILHTHFIVILLLSGDRKRRIQGNVIQGNVVSF
jgi:hypothetical protein